ncbi:MAG TPA: response regulator [Polyangia bacterium]|jgi:CheY-like chemotaxis protein|nr:response regulator [Polyangia bacterium]
MATSAVEVGTCRILVVEDNEDVAEVLRELLLLDGHTVEVATDGASALAQAPAFAPSVVLVDIGLPDLDGYEVGRRLRAILPRTITLVALTGFNTPDDKRQAVEAGFDAHLVKPIDHGTLTEILARSSVAPVSG